MRARILPPEEWARVEGDMPMLLPYVEPQNIAIVAVEDDEGKIIGCLSALQVTHLEGVWIAPEHRGHGGALRALLRQACAIPNARGEHWVFGGAADGDAVMDRYVRRLGGVPMPLRFYAMRVEGQ